MVASCGGYPLDIDYYQTAKAFTGARHICKPGGTIIVLSECSQGLGKPAYVEMCREIGSMEAFLDRFVRGGAEVYNCAQRNDQWQIHNMTRAMRKCHCVLVDGGLTAEQRGAAASPGHVVLSRGPFGRVGPARPGGDHRRYSQGAERLGPGRMNVTAWTTPGQLTGR